MSDPVQDQAQQEDASNDQKQPNMTPTNDLSQRISMGTWHPRENTFAVAKHNSLFIYAEKRQSSSNNDSKRRERPSQNDREMQQ